MPLLGVLFTTLMSGMVAFFMRYVTRKIAVLAVAIGMLATVSAALLFTFNSIVRPLAGQMFNNEMGQFVGLAFPPVAGTCLGAMGACWAACALYGWQTRALSLAVQA